MSEALSVPMFKVAFAWKTHRGNFRPNNEDSVLVRALGDTAEEASVEGIAEAQGEFTSGGDGCMAVICDGVGGGAAGEIASLVASRFLYDRVQATAVEARDAADDVPAQSVLLTAVRESHQAILQRVAEDRALEGMGTTLTGIWLHGPRLHLAQIGDSRLYRLRAGKLEQLSQDQSLVGGLRRKGAITEAEARRHPLRNIIDQALGGSQKEVVPEIAHFDLLPRDELLVCTDGLTDALPDSTLRHILVKHADDDEATAVQGLLQAALDSAGRDNISLALLRVEPKRTRSWASRIPWLAKFRGGSGGA